MHPSLVIVFAILFAASADTDVILADLTKWAIEKGAQVNVKIGLTPEGHRGLLASRDILAGETLVSIPVSLALALGSTSETGPELGTMLLREMHRQDSPNRYAPYFASLPPKTRGVLCAEALPLVLAPLMHRQELIDLVHEKQRWLVQIWEGKAKGIKLPLNRAVPSTANLTLDDLKWATCMATSRSLASPSGIMFLLPIIDMANHDINSTNQVYFRANTEPARIELVADAALKMGQEVTISYGPLRNDEAAMYYGFLMGSEEAHKRLCASDLPGYDPKVQPGKLEYTHLGPDDDMAIVRFESDRIQMRFKHLTDVSRADAESNAVAVRHCNHGHQDGEYDDDGNPTENTQLCKSATHLIDQMVQSCDAALEWEMFRLQQLLSDKRGEEL